MESTLAGLSDMLGAAGQQIRREISHKTGQQSAADVFQGFIHAVNWSEPLVLGIACWHIALVTIAFLTRNHTLTHAFVFVCLCALVLLAEPINTAGQAWWRSFASQNYFDDRGVFISLMISLPTVLLLIGMLINMVRTAGDLLVQAKAAELRAKRRREATRETKKGGAQPSEGLRQRVVRDKIHS